MSVWLVMWHALWKRRLGIVAWAVGIAALAALLAVAYPTVRGNTQLDSTIANLPKGVQAAIGLGNGAGLSSPVGYLDSQYFANSLPIVLLVFAIGVAAWSISGDEQDGTLELLLANPVSRVRVAFRTPEHVEEWARWWTVPQTNAT